MAWSGIDRRKFPRANYKCLVTVRKKDGVQTFTTQTENIGAGGVCVILPERLDIFTNVDLVITLIVGPAPIRSAGSVVWTVKSCNPKKAKANCFDTGIEFTDLSKEHLALIEQVVKDLVAKEA